MKTENQFLSIEKFIEGEIEKGNSNLPIFDPSDFTIVKPENDAHIAGYYLGRFNDFKLFYALDVKMKGNGYMVACTDGVLRMIPDWKNLENKMKVIQVGEPLRVVVVGIETLSKGDGETFIKCAVWRGL